MKITIDTREQTPWSFDESGDEVRIGTVKTGDYCVTGDAGFAVERKSFDDFLGTISKGWARFCREIYRAKEHGFTLPIVVEGSLSDCLFHLEEYDDAVGKYAHDMKFRSVVLDGILEKIRKSQERTAELKREFEKEWRRIVPPQHDHDRLTPAFVLKRIGELQQLGASVFFAERAEYAVAAAYAMLHARWVELKDDEDVRREEDTREG